MGDSGAGHSGNTLGLGTLGRLWGGFSGVGHSKSWALQGRARRRVPGEAKSSGRGEEFRGRRRVELKI